jgi:hypothetical protein
MTKRDEQFISNTPSLHGTVTRFEVVRHELRGDRAAIAITVAIDWVLAETPGQLPEEPTPWLVTIYGRSKDGVTAVLAEADSSAATIHSERTSIGNEQQFEIEMVIELPVNLPIPSLEATIRRHEAGMVRSPVGEVIGYIEKPDLGPLIARASPELVKWLHGELNSLRTLIESIGSQVPDGSQPAQKVSLADARFAVYAPSRIQRGQQFLLEVWAFGPELQAVVTQEATQRGRAQLLGSKGPVPVTVGTTISVSVAIPSFEVDPPIDAAVWDGQKANTSFAVRASSDAAMGSQVGSATVSSGGVPLAVVRFELELADTTIEHRRTLVDEQTRIRSVFASYASDDRLDVLQWARGAEVAGLEVFVDVLTLREGSAWEKELARHVPAKDLFCLFWSAAASQSKWVDMEWRCALAARGLDYIHPVPLADPRVVAPPEELRSKHFSSTSFLVREYEKQMGRKASPPTSS